MADWRPPLLLVPWLPRGARRQCSVGLHILRHGCSSRSRPYLVLLPQSLPAVLILFFRVCSVLVFLPFLLYSTVVYILYFTVWRPGLPTLTVLRFCGPSHYSVRSRQPFPPLYTLLFPLQATLPAHLTLYCRVRL